MTKVGTFFAFYTGFLKIQYHVADILSYNNLCDQIQTDQIKDMIEANTGAIKRNYEAVKKNLAGINRNFKMLQQIDSKLDKNLEFKFYLDLKSKF